MIDYIVFWFAKAVVDLLIFLAIVGGLLGVWVYLLNKKND